MGTVLKECVETSNLLLEVVILSPGRAVKDWLDLYIGNEGTAMIGDRQELTVLELLQQKPGRAWAVERVATAGRSRLVKPLQKPLHEKSSCGKGKNVAENVSIIPALVSPSGVLCGLLQPGLSMVFEAAKTGHAAAKGCHAARNAEYVFLSESVLSGASVSPYPFAARKTLESSLPS
jgi:hypothetical protein